MRARQIWIKNLGEVQAAERMELNIIPEIETITVDFLFRIRDVETATIDTNGDILLQYPSGQYKIAYSQEIWQRLEKHFNQDENE